MKKMNKLCKLSKTKLYYLASPYSVTEPMSQRKAAKIRKQRYEEVTDLAIKLIRDHSIDLVLPITTSHALRDVDETVGMAWASWKKMDTNLVKHCDALLVATMPGYDHSIGVQAEMLVAREHNKPIYYIDSLTLAAWRE